MFFVCKKKYIILNDFSRTCVNAAERIFMQKFAAFVYYFLEMILSTMI